MPLKYGMARRLLVANFHYYRCDRALSRCTWKKKRRTHGVYSSPGGGGDTENEITTLCLPSYSAVGPTVQVYIISFREKLLFGSAIMPGRLLGARTFIILSGARTNRSGTEGVNDFSGFVAVFYYTIYIIIVVVVVNLRSFAQGSRPCTTRPAARPSEPTAR